LKPLIVEILTAAQRFGWRYPIVEDGQGDVWSYQRLFVLAMVVRQQLQALPQLEKVGLLMPNHPMTLAVLLGVWLSGKRAAMLNVTTGAVGIQAAMQVAGVETLISTQGFMQSVNGQVIVDRLQPHYQWLWADDWLLNLAQRSEVDMTALLALPELGQDDEAIILFTSGSEGMPKGVSLSHTNLLSNIAQTCERLDFNHHDRFFIALPMFHSFGLTVGCLLPLVQGICFRLFPSPLLVKAIPESIRQHQSTVLFGSSSLLHQWGRNAQTEDFASLRYVIAGAEKLQPSVRLDWQQRFGIDILEGYGVTETSPVIAVNTYQDHVAGSVGRLVQGMSAKLVSVEGLAEGGRLWVRGPNVMRGYYLPMLPGQLTPLAQACGDGEWYDTGDLARFDDTQHLIILGRQKRFAKVGGEMVSLELTEQLARASDEQYQYAAVSVSNVGKGERIVLVTTNPRISRVDLAVQCKLLGISELALPRDFVVVDALPMLASGKLDLVALSKLAQTK
jgi:acyl-[acyl-carrier-protein]-phospholipid O-acyltransferase/long-chain-fatty-acid--[acyl-carrier-protein] ligase